MPGTAPCQMPRACSVSRCRLSWRSSSKTHTQAALARGAGTAKFVASGDQVAPSGWFRPGHTGATSPRLRQSPGVTRPIVADDGTMPGSGQMHDPRARRRGGHEMGEFVRLEVADGVGTIRLDRPKMNALNAQVQEEIRGAALEAAGRDDARAGGLEGGERVFAAGVDIKEMADMSYTDMVRQSTAMKAAYT